MELFNFYSVMDTGFNRRAMTIMDDQPPSNMSLDVLEYVAAVYNFCTHGRRRRASASTPRGRRVDAAESSRRRRGAVASTPRGVAESLFWCIATRAARRAHLRAHADEFP